MADIKSQSSDRKYSVILTEKGWECNCPDHMERGVTCKHAFAVKFSISLRDEVRKNVIIVLGVQISHQTIYNWIGKYVSLMEEYLDGLTPQVSDVWRTDEIYLKVRGNLTNLFSMMDDEIRFWISQMVADNKGTSDVRPIYQEAKRITGKRPAVFINDGVANFHDAYRKEFYSNSQTTKHIRHIHLAGDKNNNKIESMNREIRDGGKVFRGLKTKDSSILKGYQLYHNFARPYGALNGKTSADACRIVVEGEDKWRTLIEDAMVKT